MGVRVQAKETNSARLCLSDLLRKERGGRECDVPVTCFDED